MDWNDQNQIRLPFLSRPSDQSSFTFLYNYDPHCPPVACTEMKHPMITQTQHTVVPKNNFVEMKKKRLTSEQLESLEMSFREEVKLEPDRKMKLAQELGLQPRQVAVWFQNRRARWKVKELERLYYSLKHQLDHVSREKHKLEEEVMVLRAIIQKEEATKKQQVSAGCTDISGEDTVESTSVVAVQSSNYRHRYQNKNQSIGDGYNYVFNAENYNIPPYWSAGVMPSNP